MGRLDLFSDSKTIKNRIYPLRRTIHILLLGTGFIFIAMAILTAVIVANQARSIAGIEKPADCVEPMKVDYPAPAIRLTDVAGSVVSLADHRGDVILLNTWATWCPPCRREMPDLETFFQTHTKEGFTLLGVNVGENPETVVQFVDTFHLTFPIWLDPDESTLQSLNSFSLPYSIVIDREGVVRYAWSGATCLMMLENTISPMLRQ
jgi:peroxiredoxin